MAKIVGTEGMSDAEIHAEIQKGGRFVIYAYAISIIILSFRRTSDVHFIRAGQSAVTPGLPYVFITLFFGWWGIPFGPIFSIQALASDLSGGKDVTQQLLNR
jgi:hypothetical protein